MTGTALEGDNMNQPNRIAIVGFGGAGYRAAEEARRVDPNAVIDVYSDTNIPPYNPMLTTYYVKGAIPYEALFPFGPLDKIIERLNINFHGETPVTALIPEKKVLQFADGTEKEYDNILFSTGASAFAPRVPGIDLDGVFKMRTAFDSVHLKEMLAKGNIRSALVVGASWVGIKIVEDMVEAGIDCTLVDGARWIFPVAAFEQTAERIHADLERKGVKLAFEQMLSSIEREPDGRLTAVMQNGNRFTADTVAVCIGIRTNIGFLLQSGLNIGRALQVDHHMRTNFEGIYAAGDCCEAPETQTGTHKNIGVWLNAQNQGTVAGNNMAGGNMLFDANVLLNLAHYLHYDFLSIGDVSLCKPGDPDDQVYEYEDERYYLRAVKRDKMIKCINMISTAEVNGIFKNLFIKSFENPDAEPDPKAIAVLYQHKIPKSFLTFLGWEF